MCAIDDGEGFEFSRGFMRKARKEHRCCECGRGIEVGERHEYMRGLYDGSWDTFRTCAHCIAARSWLRVECRGWLYCGVGEELEQHWDDSGEYRSAWLARAIVGMRRQWKRRDGSLLPVMDPWQPRQEAA